MTWGVDEVEFGLRAGRGVVLGAVAVFARAGGGGELGEGGGGFLRGVCGGGGAVGELRRGKRLAMRSAREIWIVAYECEEARLPRAAGSYEQETRNFLGGCFAVDVQVQEDGQRQREEKSDDYGRPAGREGPGQPVVGDGLFRHGVY